MSSSHLSDNSEGGEEMQNTSLDFDFLDFIAPLKLNDFLQYYWGKKIHQTSISKDQLQELTDGFHDCSFEDIVADCRKDDNSKYSNEDIDEMTSKLNDNITINLPFCFTPGARAFKNCFLKSCSNYGNDIEVGIYFSVVGGKPMPWHFDNNHNITIQLQGSKDWLLIPAGKDNVTSSRELHDLPLNQAEQRVEIPSTGQSSYDSHRLTPGSVLYVPPGHWHSVVPNSGESMSIDLRVADVSHAKWIAEAVYALISEIPNFPKPRTNSHLDGFRSASVKGTDFLPEGNGIEKLKDWVKKFALDNIQDRCRLPRSFLSQPSFSDGLKSGATVDFLYDTYALEDMEKKYLLGETFFINPLVSCITRLPSEAHELVLSFRSVSSLTKSDYLNFELICSRDLLSFAKSLQIRGKVAVDLICEGRKQNTSHCKGCSYLKHSLQEGASSASELEHSYCAKRLKISSEEENAKAEDSDDAEDRNCCLDCYFSKLCRILTVLEFGNIVFPRN